MTVRATSPVDEDLLDTEDGWKVMSNPQIGLRTCGCRLSLAGRQVRTENCCLVKTGHVEVQVVDCPLHMDGIMAWRFTDAAAALIAALEAARAEKAEREGRKKNGGYFGYQLGQSKH